MDDEKKLEQLKIVRRLLLITLLLFVAVFILMNTSYISADNFKRSVFDIKTAFGGKNSNVSKVDITENLESEAAVYKDGIVMVSKNIVTIYSAGLYKYSEFSVNLINPVLRTSKKYCLAFDRGGKTAYLFDSFNIVHTFSCAENIINAGVSDSGNIFIITDSPGYKARLTVYNSSCAEIFNWDSADKYVLDAAPGNGYVWAVSLSQAAEKTNTILQKINYDKATVQETVSVEDEFYVSVAIKNDNTVCLITDKSLLSVRGGEAKPLHTFTTNEISRFSQTESYTFFSFDNNVSLLDTAGNALFTKQIADIEDITIHGALFYVLHSDILTVYSSTGEQAGEYSVSEASGKILAVDGACFIVGADFIEKIIL